MGQAPHRPVRAWDVTLEPESHSEPTSPHHLPQDTPGSAVPMPSPSHNRRSHRYSGSCPIIFDMLPTPPEAIFKPPFTPTGGISAAKPDGPKEAASPPLQRLADSRHPPAWQCHEEWLMESSEGPREL